MSLFDKSLRDVEWVDLDILIAIGEPEGELIDYKCPNDITGARRSLAQSVCSFANSAGGWLVVGVKESKGAPQPNPPGVASSVGQFAVRDWIEQVIHTRVQPVPHIETAQISVPGSSSNAVVIVRTPPSYALPHMFDHRFYVRHGARSEPAGVIEARSLFDRSRRVVADRIELRSARGLTTPGQSAGVKLGDVAWNVDSQRLRAIQSSPPDRSQHGDPRVVFGAIPEFPRDGGLGTSLDVANWLRTNRLSSAPEPSRRLVESYARIIWSQHYAAAEEWHQNEPDLLDGYLRIEDTGYTEFARAGIGQAHEGRSYVCFVDLVGRFWQFLGLLREVHTLAPSIGGWTVVVAVGSIRDATLSRLGGGWADAASPHTILGDPPHCREDVLLVEPEFRGNEDDKELFGVVRSVAEEIDRTFGHDTSEGIRCFSREDQSVFDVKNYLV